MIRLGGVKLYGAPGLTSILSPAQFVVTVHSCANLPLMSKNGSTNAKVVLTARVGGGYKHTEIVGGGWGGGGVAIKCI